MRESVKRTAAFAAAIAGFALIGSGCSHGNKSSETAGSATASVTSSTTTQTATATESASPTSTQIPGANGTAYPVEGPILAKYLSLDETARKSLGAPTGDEQKNPDGGVYQQFDGGVIVHKTSSYVVWGLIRDKWNELGGSQGKLGYPTSDEVDTPDGLKKTTFEHGTITWNSGANEVTVAYN